MLKLASQLTLALCTAAFACLGCGNSRSDLLVVSTADCQGYLEPCG